MLKTYREKYTEIAPMEIILSFIFLHLFTITAGEQTVLLLQLLQLFPFFVERS